MKWGLAGGQACSEAVWAVANTVEAALAAEVSREHDDDEPVGEDHTRASEADRK
jgi:hypothetical protein